MSYRVPLQHVPLQPGIVLTLRRRFILVRLPGVLLLVAASLFVTVIGPSALERGVGWFGVLFFARLFLIGLRRVFDTRPQYWINAEGVYCLRSPGGLIRWQRLGCSKSRVPGRFCFWASGPLVRWLLLDCAGGAHESREEAFGMCFRQAADGWARSLARTCGSCFPRLIPIL